MKLKIKYIFLVTLTFVFVQSGTAQYTPARKFQKVLNLVESYYVDSVEADKLVEVAIEAMLKELDPHTVYMDQKEFKSLNEPLKGNFEGIGIQFNILQDTIIVVSTISGGPSQKVGLLAGDRIVKIDDETVAGTKIKNSGVRKRLLGKKGTKVSVTVKRTGIDELMEYTIIRDKIPIFSVDAAYMIDKKTGYIKINRFAATTHDEFLKAVKELKKEGLKDLVLDLGSNGGGYLNMAIKMADEFLKNNQLIVYTEGINNPKKSHFATNKGEMEKGRLVILIDEGSASASEILSGAVQDWDRGIIVGRRSFGKGLVQRQIELFDSTAIRLTIAHYYTPTGRSIQKPYDKGEDNYHKEISNRYDHGEMVEKDSIHFPDSLKYKTMVKERTVYGGGGIMPDFFVPLDTATFTSGYRKLIQKGVINRVTLAFVDANRNELKASYPTFEKYNKDFSISDELMQELWNAAEKDKINKDSLDLELFNDHLLVQMKALIARDLFSTSEYYEVINSIDPAFQKACEIIIDKKKYNSVLRKQ